MTHKEAIQKYYEFRDTYKGKYIDIDNQYGAQCWDLAQKYFTEYLGVPSYVLGGCDLVSNMLYPPKIDDLLEYFVEVPLDQMDPGDVVIWEYGHIAIFDNWDGNTSWFFSQNPNPCDLIVINRGGEHAFRLKTNDDFPIDYKKLYFDALDEIEHLQAKIDKALEDLK